MSISDDELREAVAVLRRGGLVAFPTETVYGLGVDATNPDALRRLYAVKGRPPDHPVIVHLAHADALDDWSDHPSAEARRLTAACWPGPLTVIVRRSRRVVDEVTGGRATVGLRVPDQPVAHALLHAFGGGIAAPSANRFGRVSPTTAADVRADLGPEVDLVLDGGPCDVGVESTIVDCTGDAPLIVRVGGVTRAVIDQVLGHPVDTARPGSVASPGTLPAHYAPAARVHVVTAVDAGARARALVERGRRVALLAPVVVPDTPREAVVLDRPADVEEYARVLYARLREADALQVDDVLVVPPAAAGLGEAVVDRVQRAAHAGGDA